MKGRKTIKSHGRKGKRGGAAMGRRMRGAGSASLTNALSGIMADKLREAYNISAEFHRQAMEAFREPVDGPRDERGNHGEGAAF